jgi:hypothetical protein
MLFDRLPDPTTMWGQLTSEPMLDISVFQARTKRGPTQTHPLKKERETEVAYSASYVLVGAHVETVNDPLLDRVVFGLSNLEDWCNTTGFTGKVERPVFRPSKDAPVEASVELSFQDSATHVFDIGGGRRLRFLSLYRGPEYFDREKQVELRERNRIEIVFPKLVSIEQALDEIRIWQTFIAFGLRIPVFLDDIIFLRGSGKRLQPMHLYVPERRREVPKRNRYRPQVLFDQARLGKALAKCLREWRQHQNSIGTAVLLFRGACYLNDVYIHTNVLTYLQALEVFHRAAYKGDKFPNAGARKSTLSTLRKAIPKHLDATLRRELAEGLSYVGSPSLLDHLKSLFHKYPNASGRFSYAEKRIWCCLRTSVIF